jgi:geranylgeranyl pyrophosphate synthase
VKRLQSLFEDFAAVEATTRIDARWPATLAKATRHTLFGGGKRVRPVLALMAAEAVGGSPHAALSWALAVEMIHTYSLVHDDLPAMDDDDERRGRPTVHIAYDEATAILVGDALLTEAFALVAETPQLVTLLAHAAGGHGMVGGQVLDIEGVSTLDALVIMQSKKTGALIRAAIEGGAIAAGATPAQLAALGAYGDALGLLFQMTDDLIDEEQDADADGRSFLHHMSKTDLHARIVQTTADAKTALTPLAKPQALRDFADFIAQRTV